MSLTVNGNKLYIGQRFVGEIVRISGAKIFRSKRNRFDQYFKIFEGWGLSKIVYDYLKSNNVQEIQLLIGTREILISRLEDWAKNAKDYKAPPFEWQMILPERFMKRHFLPESMLSP